MADSSLARYVAGEGVGHINGIDLGFDEDLARRNVQFPDQLLDALVLLRRGLNQQGVVQWIGD